MGGVFLPFLKHIKHKKKSSTYTLMIIPGKYGTVKSLVIPKLLLWVFLLAGTSIFITLFLFFMDYKSAKLLNTKSMKDIEILKHQSDAQQQELKSYVEIEDELKNKLEELKVIEDQLKSRLNSTSDAESQNTFTFASAQVSLKEVDDQIESLYSLINKYDKKVAEERKLPTVLPCSGRISSYFGKRKNPVSRGRTETHHGVDITNSYRTPIKASADGVVEYAGWLRSYGYTVIINHQNGYKSLYGHNSKLIVKKSQNVKRGQTISLMGSTGRSTGTHVHFEVRFNGSPVNPLKITKGGNL